MKTKRILPAIIAVVIAFTFTPSADAAVKKMNVKATSKTNSITLKWKKVNGATGYEVRKVLPKKWHKFKLVKKNNKNKKKFTKKGLFKVTAKGKKWQVYKFYSKTEKFGKKNTTKKLTYTKNNLKANAKYNLIVNAKKKKKIIAKKTISVKTEKKTTTTTGGGSTNTGGGSTNTGDGDLGVNDIDFSVLSVSVEAGKTTTATANVGVKSGTVISSDKFSVKSSNANASAKIKSINTSTRDIVVEITGKTAGEATITLSGYNKSATITAKVTASGGGAEGGGTVTPTTNKLQYKYEIYRLTDADLYSENTDFNYVIVKTTNPDPDEVCPELVNASTGEAVQSTSFDKPSKNVPGFNHKYRDLNIPDRDGQWYYYRTKIDFTESGANYYYIVEEDPYTGEIAKSEDKIKITTKSYSAEFDKWLNGYLQMYPTGTATQRMLKITSAMEESAKYTCKDAYSVNVSFKLRCLPQWKVGYWHSLYHEPMLRLAEIFGATSVKRWDEVGASYSSHRYLWITFNGMEDAFEICPEETTAESISSHDGELTLSKYTLLGTINK